MLPLQEVLKRQYEEYALLQQTFLRMERIITQEDYHLYEGNLDEDYLFTLNRMEKIKHEIGDTIMALYQQGPNK